MPISVNCSPLPTARTAGGQGWALRICPPTRMAYYSLQAAATDHLQGLFWAAIATRPVNCSSDTWSGTARDSVYVELQQNFLRGDARRNREMAALAHDSGVPVVATNDIHYHLPERHRLQHALVAAKRNSTIDQALPFIRPNRHLSLKNTTQMERLFQDYPEAIANTTRIAEGCAFNLSTDLGYTLRTRRA